MGEVADCANGVISLCRGDFLDAGLSFASMIPVFGDVIGKGGKVAKGVIENADIIVKNLDEAVEVANKEQKTIVIGESMSRVKQATKKLQESGVDAKWYQAWEKNFPKNGEKMSNNQFEESLKRNERWLKGKIDGNYQIVDIGIDIKKENRSPFYAKEKELINKSNYPIIKVED